MANPSNKPNSTAPADEWSDEWLSAYVDGELDAQQRAAVEQRLKADPAAQALVDSFRQVSNTLRSAPTGRAPDALAAGVARRIAETPLEHVTPGKSARRLLVGTPRRWMWAGIAVAASLMFAFLGPQEDQKVALETGSSASGSANSIKAKPALADMAGADVAVGDGPIADRGLAGGERPTGVAASTAPAAPAIAAASGADPTLDLASERDTLAPSEEAAPAWRRSEPAVASSTPPPPLSEAPSPVRSAPLPSAAPAMAADAAREVLADTRSARFGGEVIPPQAMVRLNLDEAALNSDEFSRVLIDNGINVQQDTAPARIVSQLAAVGIRLQPAFGGSADDPLDRPADSFLLHEGNARGRLAGEGERADRHSDIERTEETGNESLDKAHRPTPRLFATNTGALLANTSNEREFVLVDAPAPQLEQCLAQFHGNDEFQSIQVEPTAAVQQRSKQLAQRYQAESLYDVQQQRVEPWRGYSRAGYGGKRAFENLTQAPAPSKQARSKGFNGKTKPPTSAPAGFAYRFVTKGNNRPAITAPGDTAAAKVAPPTVLPAADRVQVLFVLETPPSKPSK